MVIVGRSLVLYISIVLLIPGVFLSGCSAPENQQVRIYPANSYHWQLPTNMTNMSFKLVATDSMNCVLKTWGLRDVQGYPELTSSPLILYLKQHESKNVNFTFITNSTNPSWVIKITAEDFKTTVQAVSKEGIEIKGSPASSDTNACIVTLGFFKFGIYPYYDFT
jgi:hypothetical protein